MQCLSLQEFKTILELVRELYQACTLEAFANHTLSILQKIVPSEVAYYSNIDFQSCEVSMMSCPSLNPPDVKLLEQTARQYFYEHPCIRNYLRTRDERTYKISDFLSENQLHKLEGLYGQFLHPVGMEDQIGFLLSTSSLAPNNESRLCCSQKEIILISLHRNQRNFSERDRFVLNLLGPHLFQAYENAKSFTQVQNELVQMRQATERLGMIVLTSNGQVQVMTQQAWLWLTKYFQTRLRQAFSLPDNLQQWVKYQMSLVVSDSELSLPRLPLQVEREGRRLIVSFIVEPLGNQYLLLLEEQQSVSLSAETLELLGLTKREAEILYWVAQGKSNAEIASIVASSSRTVKKHLEHIYQKLGVQTRATAVTCALECLGILNQ